MRTREFMAVSLILGLTGLTMGMVAVFAQGSDKFVKGKPALTQAAKVRFFEAEVKPILTANCVPCHGGGAAPSGGLTMTSRDALLKGGSSGAAIDPAKPQASLLIKAVQYDGRQMPPRGKLPQSQIATLVRWAEMGFPWSPEKKGAGETPVVHHGPPTVNAETMNFWSFRPVKRPKVPAVKQSAWVRNPIDAFVLAKLEKAGLKPAPPADKVTLLRRAYYDLVGLPPTPEQVKAFLTDKSPRAYEKVVDTLLASPQYGEKWARHWLDLVRYAETNSFERDSPKPNVWRYRDYVIRSLNADKPYDQFIREQLAGDELDKTTYDTLIATGYYRLGTWDDEPVDPLQARYDELDDIVATTGQVFLGLTVNCARCHDHKLDPIPQKDYYRMLSFFQGITRYGGSGGSVEDNSLRPLAPVAEIKKNNAIVTEYRKTLENVNKEIAETEKIAQKDFQPVEKEEFRSEERQVPILQKRVPKVLSQERFNTYVALRMQRKQLQDNPPPTLEQALCVTERGRKPEPSFVLLRGNPHAQGDPVEPGFLSVMAPPRPALRELAPDVPSSGRRLALANWITSPSNQLTARVMVNRLWQHHFGRGIVRSTSNFGSLGTPPTHPELLDWMAAAFMQGGEGSHAKTQSRKKEKGNRAEGASVLRPAGRLAEGPSDGYFSARQAKVPQTGTSLTPDHRSLTTAWSLKKMHRMMLLSSTYRMSSQGNRKALAKDPENDLFWRFNMRRLDAEEIRDSILAVNGTLNPKMFGPSIYPIIEKEVLAGQSVPGAGWTVSTPEEQARRSIYVHIKRSLTLPLLASFDAADTDFSCPVRFATTQPTQALSMINSRFSNEQARIFADYLLKKAGLNPTAQVRLALWRTLQREPTQKEVARGVRYLTALQQEHNLSMKDALRSFCVLALNLNEFLYLD